MGDAGRLGKDYGARFKVVELPSEDPPSEKIIKIGLETAAKGYAPFSEAYSSVVLRCKSGELYEGFYIECCAYNPSLPPMQAALINLVRNKKGYAEIEEVVLFEKEHDIS